MQKRMNVLLQKQFLKYIYNIVLFIITVLQITVVVKEKNSIKNKNKMLLQIFTQKYDKFKKKACVKQGNNNNNKKDLSI